LFVCEIEFDLHAANAPDTAHDTRSEATAKRR
jgi:hypothetical protein